MGCGQCRYRAVHRISSQNPDFLPLSVRKYGPPKALMTPKQKVVLKETWSYVYDDMSDLTEIGCRVFKKLFHLNHEVKQLFTFRSVSLS